MAAALYAFLSKISVVLERLYLRLCIPGRPLASLPFAPPPPQHTHRLWAARPGGTNSDFNGILPSREWVNIQHFTARGQRLAALAKLPDVPHTRDVDYYMYRRPASAEKIRVSASITICIDVPRARKKFRHFAAGGQRPAIQRISRLTASKFLSRGSRRGAAATSITICIDVLRAKQKIQPPRSGGDIDYYTYRRLASKEKIQKFCRRRPTSRHTCNNTRPGWSRMQPAAELPRSGSDINDYVYRRPANCVKFPTCSPSCNLTCLGAPPHPVRQATATSFGICIPVPPTMFNFRCALIFTIRIDICDEPKPCLPFHCGNFNVQLSRSIAAQREKLYLSAISVDIFGASLGKIRPHKPAEKFSSDRFIFSSLEVIRRMPAATFIATGNPLPWCPDMRWFGMNIQKVVQWRLVGLLAEAYGGEGFRFYYATLVGSTGGIVDNIPDFFTSGPQHAEVYLGLISRKERGEWDHRFTLDTKQ
ncbi:hypothetical protein C8R43DRAFT_953135 [Mycena crocata]|nr:hypothetical protein C8R43DRAFT_953135 [Mycena crocata]